MANIKISELTALTPPDAADLVPVTDSSASQTKRTTVGEIVGIINGDVDVANNGTATISELPVSKLQDGDARQLLQTDAAGTGVEWTSNVDVPGTLDVTGAATLDSTLGVTGQSTLASAAVSDLTSGRVVLAGTSGELEDNAKLTFNGTQLDVDGNVVITGDLTVEGASTILETETVKVEDKNIELGVVASPTDVTADGGGITLKGTTDKTINWIDATDAWTSSERFSVPLGTEAAPSLTFTGANAGIYSPGADQVAISTNGTGRLLVDSSGNLIQYSTTTLERQHRQQVASAYTATNIKSVIDGAAGYLTFETGTNWTNGNAVERLRITSDGKCGLGTSSPDGLLTVRPTSGNAQVFIRTNDTTSRSQLIFGDSADSNTGGIQYNHATDNLEFHVGNLGEKMTLDATGRLGVGTTDAKSLLHIESTSGTTTAATISQQVTYGLGTAINARAQVNLCLREASFTADQRIFGRLEAGTESDGGSNNGFLAFATRAGGAIGEKARLTSSGQLLVGTSSVSGLGAAKTVISETSAVAAQRIIGNSNTQGAAQKITVVRHYPVVSLGTKLVIPIVSQGNLNISTLCKVWGLGARYNSATPLPFEINFAFGHTTSISNLTSWGGQGNYSSIAASGMNIEITFTTAYTNATADGVYVCLEYMTPRPDDSVNVASIAMN